MWIWTNYLIFLCHSFFPKKGGGNNIYLLGLLWALKDIILLKYSEVFLLFVGTSSILTFIIVLKLLLLLENWSGGLLNQFGNEFQNLSAIYNLCCSQNSMTIQKLFYPLFLVISPPTIHRCWVTRNQKGSLCSGYELELISTLGSLPNPEAGGTSGHCSTWDL